MFLKIRRWNCQGPYTKASEILLISDSHQKLTNFWEVWHVVN
jgi:hypothetical protein